MTDRVGQRFDAYRLLRYLGSGSFGEVYLAKHIKHGTQVAIKIFPRFAEKDWPAFLNEARIIRLKHQHILPVLDFGIEDAIPFLVMEYIPAGTVRDHYPKGNVLPLDRVVQYLKQMASALQYAHDEKLIHRDVKPENILMRSEHELVLGDFGIVAIAHTSASFRLQKTVGTLPYMAPEQMRGKAVRASDQYALGIITYEWLCGERPFQGGVTELVAQHLEVAPPSLTQKNPALSIAVEKIVFTALAKEPTQRFRNVLAFAEALDQAHRTPVLPPDLPPQKRLSTQTLAPTLEQPIKPSVVHTAVAKQAVPANIPAAPQHIHFTLPHAVPQILPSLPSESVISPKTPLAKKSPRQFLLLILIFIFLFTSVGGGYYFLQIRQNQTTTATLNNAEQLLNQANGEVVSHPVQALQDLAVAQQQLYTLQNLDDNANARLTSMQTQLVAETQNAIITYNQEAKIALLPCTNTVNATTTGAQGQTVTVLQLQKDGPVLYYILGVDGNIYQSISSGNQLILQSSFVPPNTQITNMIGAGDKIFALSKQTFPDPNSSSSSYALDLLLPTAYNTLQSMQEQNFSSLSGPYEQLLTALANNAYVVLFAKSDPKYSLILSFTLDSQSNLVVSPHCY